jgi:hypothetical protein
LREKVAAKRPDEGSRDACRLADEVQHFIRIERDQVVREAEDSETLSLQPGVAPRVMVGVVERTVRFDDQTMPKADEVGDIWPNRDLPSELQIL